MTFPISAALLDALVLAVAAREDTYGYRITQDIRTAVEVSESTLYPVLRRLQKEENLETYDREFQGRNRRYYRVTPKGRAALELYREEWKLHRKKIEDIILSQDNTSPPQNDTILCQQGEEKPTDE
ncbi:MAG: helix-turn-helix transcriptional regulator [Oscillospiraceae bacterium]|nr:helix-turn-helix transcriptional regulator [Oscillospiraceae bacterium]